MSASNQAVPELTNHEAVLARICTEITDRKQAGERIDLEPYLARMPERAEQIRRLALALNVLDGLKDPSAPSTGTPATETGLTGTLGDFRIVREVGRGGMAVVYEAEQISLQRRVALKVLPFAAMMDPRHLQRFQNEARAAASLHHEHIVPVYGVGCERGVHYYAMQFIDGQTLAQVIRQRGAPEVARDATTAYPPTAETLAVANATTQRQPRDSAYFRRVAEWGIAAAEALEHAHSLGIVHRDIKPGNLMLDAQGKLWVTDFGLARTGSDSGLTMTGDVLGTLRYMSPEQALAKHGLVDHRTDVYALGATLYELLTLRPAVPGEDREEILRKITFDDPKNPRSLDRAIPLDLETIVLKALAKEPNERYLSARDLAEDLRRVLRDEPVLAKPPSLLQRGRKWAWRKRAVLWPAAASLLVAVLALAGGVGWAARDRAARRAEAEWQADEALQEAERLYRQSRWPAALEASRRAEGLLAGVQASPGLRRRVEEWLAGLEMLERLEEVGLSRTSVRDGHFDVQTADREFGRAFRDYGIDVDALDTQEAAELVRSRPVWQDLAAALDHWAVDRRLALRDGGAGSRRLLAVARAADPDPVRDRLRDALAAWDRQALEGQAASDEVTRLPAQSLHTLGRALSDLGAHGPAVRILRAGQRQRPGDFWLNHGLAYALSEAQPPQLDEALRYYTAAVAIHPRSPGAYLNYGLALQQKGLYNEAIFAFEEAIRLKPSYAEAHSNLGAALKGQGKVGEAVACYREALRLKPDLAFAYNNLGSALREQGKVDEAVACLREAVRHAPEDALVHYNLGIVLAARGEMDEAVASYREAVRLRPDYAEAHFNLGIALKHQGRVGEAIAAYREAVRHKPAYAEAHNNLGVALMDQGKVDEAIACYRVALRLKPDLAVAVANLGIVLAASGKLDEAIACYREAVRLKPDYAGAHHNLGVLLGKKGQTVEAVTELREAIRLRPGFPDSHYALGNLLYGLGQAGAAIKAFNEAVRLKPDHAEAHTNLGIALKHQGKLGEAVAAYKRAIRCKPDLPEPRVSLGLELLRQGEYRAALEHLRKGHELGSTRPDEQLKYAAMVRCAERVSVLDGLVKAGCRVPTVLRGELTARSPLDSARPGCRAEVHLLPLEAGRAYLITMVGVGFDGFLRVEDGERKAVAANDNRAADDPDPGLLFVPAKSGTYRVVATTTQKGDRGTYFLEVRRWQEVGPPGPFAGTLPADAPRTRGNGWPFQLITVRLEAGKSFSFELRSKDFPPRLGVRNPAGKLIAAESVGPGAAARIFLTTEKTGEYEILVVGMAKDARGGYALLTQEYRPTDEGAPPVRPPK